MPDITDPTALHFSNTAIRPAADRIVRTYRKLDKLNEEWVALGGTNDDKFALLQGKIQQVATYVSSAYWFIAEANLMWDELGLQSLFPNDTSPVIDGAPADGRSAITGQDVRRCQNRMDEFEYWLDNGPFSLTQPISVALTAATFTTATKTLTETGAFTGYTWASGDYIFITGGTGVVAGIYEVASRTNNNTIVLVDDIGGTNPADVTSSVSTAGNDVNLRTFVRMAEQGSKAPTTNWGRIIAVVRAGEIKKEYETTNVNKYNQLVLCSVNGDLD